MSLIPNFFRYLEGFRKLIILSTLDDMLRLIVGKPWFNYKMRLSDKRALNAIIRMLTK